jgi:Restriction endonuclease BglII
MSNPPAEQLAKLEAKGFQIDFHCHAKAILSLDFPEAFEELEGALIDLTIPIEEIIASGGGEAKGTQRLRKALNARNWMKKKFEIKKTINNREHESISHEIDHVRELASGNIALEIEWNNKDPFLDRDLENFKRLHADGAISLGVVITRGKSLQDEMHRLIERFVEKNDITSFADLEKWHYAPTTKQRLAIEKRTNRKRNPVNFAMAFVDKFVSDKFGEAATHWRKLEDRIHRGVGNPCPMMLIGLPASIVTFGEAERALKEIRQDEEEAEDADLFDWRNDSA